MLAKLFFNLDLDWHAVAIPSRHILRIKTIKLTGFDDHIFQNFIDRVADMNITIGIGRAVMQNKFRSTDAHLANTLIQIFFLPLGHPLRLTFGHIAAHRKRGLGHVDRIFTIGLARCFFVGHGFRIQNEKGGQSSLYYQGDDGEST